MSYCYMNLMCTVCNTVRAFLLLVLQSPHISLSCIAPHCTAIIRIWLQIRLWHITLRMTLDVKLCPNIPTISTTLSDRIVLTPSNLTLVISNWTLQLGECSNWPLPKLSTIISISLFSQCTKAYFCIYFVYCIYSCTHNAVW